MSSAYKRQDKYFQRKMAELADQRDADRAYYERLLGRELVQHEAERTQYAWKMARVGPMVGAALIGAALLILAVWRAL